MCDFEDLRTGPWIEPKCAPTDSSLVRCRAHLPQALEITRRRRLPFAVRVRHQRGADGAELRIGRAGSAELPLVMLGHALVEESEAAAAVLLPRRPQEVRSGATVASPHREMIPQGVDRGCSEEPSNQGEAERGAEHRQPP